MRDLIRDRRVLVALALTALVVAGVALAIQAGELSVPLTQSQMPGFELLRERSTTWQVSAGSHGISEQVWRHVSSGASLEVGYGRFESPDAARAACEGEVEVTQLIAEPGTFSGAPLGDYAWRWPLGGVAARLVFCSGTHAVSVHLVGRPLPEDAAGLVEAAARTVLANLNKGE